MRRDSWRSVPMMCRPPAASTCSWRFCQSSRISFTAASSALPLASICACGLPPSTMSVPRPAMLVAMVTAPGRPASATMCASRSCCLAFSTSCGMLRALQQLREPLGGLDRSGADQHRLAALHAVLDVLENGLELVVLGEEHEIRVVLADHRLVGRDHHHLEAVDLLELERLGVGGAGHAGELRVQAEIVLEGDGGDRLVLLAHLARLPSPRPPDAGRRTSAGPAWCVR